MGFILDLSYSIKKKAIATLRFLWHSTRLNVVYLIIRMKHSKKNTKYLMWLTKNDKNRCVLSIKPYGILISEYIYVNYFIRIIKKNRIKVKVYWALVTL